MLDPSTCRFPKWRLTPFIIQNLARKNYINGTSIEENGLEKKEREREREREKRDYKKDPIGFQSLIPSAPLAGSLWPPFDSRFDNLYSLTLEGSHDNNWPRLWEVSKARS